ncbi:unnamed protein product [Cunninghamella echinulata]
MIDILSKYFPEKRIIYVHNPYIDSQLYDAICKRKEELKNLIEDHNEECDDEEKQEDPIKYLSRRQRLCKNWKPAIIVCLEEFDISMIKIKNRSQHLTDEQLNAIQLTEEDFDEDDIPNNQQQLKQKGKGKRKEIIMGYRNKISTQAGPSSFSKRKIHEIDSSDEESSSSDCDSICNRRISGDEESGHDSESSNVVTRLRASSSLSSRKKLKQAGGRRRLRNFWTDLEVITLEEGMKDHGPNWPKIKEQYHDILKNRTVGDLKDKAVNVIKKCYKKGVSTGYFENIYMNGGFRYLLKLKKK